MLPPDVPTVRLAFDRFTFPDVSVKVVAIFRPMDGIVKAGVAPEVLVTVILT
jgi:hypothetical protein